MAILRSVARTDTFEVQRQKINLIAQDLFTVQTSVGSGAFSMSDGSVQSPALFFTNADDVGIYRGSTGKQLFIGSEGSSVARFDKDFLTSLQNFRTYKSPISTQGGLTISNAGSGYNIGTYPKVNLTGGNGSGAIAEVVTSVVGDLTSGGGGYAFGGYQLVPLTGGSGNGIEATVTVERFDGTITEPGSGGTSGLYTGVNLTGGTGTGVVADISVSALGPITGVSGVTITSFGSGYQVGQILSASSGDIGNVTGFQFELTGVGEVSDIIITNAGSGYVAGDVLGANAADLGGSGAGLQYTVSAIGALTDITITDGGDNYVVGDTLTIEQSELVEIVTYHVKILDCQLFEFNPPLPATGFNVGDTITYNGDQAPIVKRFLDGSGNIEAITTEVQNFAFISLVPGTTMDDGNGNVATPSNITNALNYFFSSTGPTGTYTNIPDFTFQKNVRYLFDQSDVSNVGHPLRFSTTPDGFHTVVVPFPTEYGEEYNGPDVDYGYAANTVSLAPNDDTPTTLYYYCGEGILGANAHIDEGGFDGREGSITISGEAQLIGSGISVSVASVDEEVNILLDKDGTATFKNTNVEDLTVTGTTLLQSDLSLSGDLAIGSNTFVVQSSTGDTVIDGGLTVNGDLAFLADAAFGGTLYVDSVNNKVSVNIDPAITPLTKDLEVSGSFSVTESSEICTTSGSILKIGDPTILATGQKLQVDGSVYVNSKIFVEPTGDVLNPSYTFNGSPRIGMTASSTSNSLSFTSTTGELLKLEPLLTTNYRNSNYDKLSVTDYSIAGGEGYVVGSYQGVALSGGTGAGFIGNITVAFSIVNSVVGAGYTDGVDLTCAFTTNGSGTGASALITIESGSISSILITDGGSGYVVGDTITIDPNQIFDAQGDPVPTSPTTNAEYTIEYDGVVTIVEPAASGEGYLQGDVLIIPSTSSLNQSQTISYVPFFGQYLYSLGDIFYADDRLYEVTQAGTSDNEPPSHENGFALNGTAEFTFLRFIKLRYTITDIDTTTTVSINKDLGKITCDEIQTLGNGIVVDNNLSIDGTTISSLQDEDITITPGSSQKLLSVSGTGGVKIPVGSSSNRPSASTLGIIRYNADTQQYEGSNGLDFISLGGVRDVDGNTYILAEEFVGANDNTLWFYNDATNTARLTTTEFTLITPQVIASREISPPKVEWEAGASATAAVLPQVNYVYFGDNLYSVDSTGTFDTDENNAPTHTSGTVSNGSVDLTFVSTVFGPLTFKASNITLDATLTLSGLDIYSYNSTALILDNSLTTTEFAFGKENGAPDTLALLTSAGELQFNRNYDTTNPQDNLTVLDKTLKFIELDDVLIKTVSVNLERGLSDTATIAIYDPTIHTAAKVMIVADNTTSDQRHMVEYSVIAAGSNISITEFGSVHTDIELFQVTFGFSPSGEISVNPVLNSAITAGDNVKLVTTFTITKK